MQPSPLLGPVVALVAWSLLVLLWLAAVRFPLLRGKPIPPGSRGADLERQLPGKTNWPAHNYAHLVEQPTLFYAIVLSLVLMDFDHPVNVWLAWGYVALRIAHSVVQITVNIVRIRMILFLLSTLCLISLTIHAALRLT